MKKLLVLFLIISFFSCGNSTDSEKTVTVSPEMVAVKKEESSAHTPVQTKEEQPSTADWEKFETEVFESIDAVKTSNETNRKERLEKFAGYVDKVDGAVAESYCNFAFTYADNHISDLFSVVTYADTLLINNWAKAAAVEAGMIIFNDEDGRNFMPRYSKKYRANIQKLEASHRKIAEYYLTKLNEYTNDEKENP